MCLRVGFFAFFLCFPCLAQEVINNNLQPKGDSYRLVLEENLRFGGDDNDETLFWTGPNTSVAADARGHMFISDVGQRRVLEFDNQGHFVRLLGSQGQGPGEYQGLPSLQIFADGTAIGFDAVPMSIPRFNFYDAQMGFLEMKLPNGAQLIPAAAFFSPQGDKFSGTFMKFGDGKLLMKVGIMNMEFKLVKEVSELVMPMPNFSRMGEPQFWVDLIAEGLKRSFLGTGLIGFTNQGAVYTASTDRYEITRWSGDLTKKQTVIRKKYKAVAYQQADIDGQVENTLEQFSQMPSLASIVTRSVIEKGVEKAEFPPKKNPLFGLLVTEDDYLLAITDIQLGTGIQKADIYSSDGHYLGQASIGGQGFYNLFAARPRMSFRNGFAYTVLIGEDGGLQVVRYKAKVEKI